MTHARARRETSQRRAPASTDVARRAGVSQKTVSRVMNDEPLVSDAVRAKVRQAARDLGYRPNQAARALANGRTFTLGFVSLGTTLHGPVATLVAAEQAARSHGYSMSIATTPASDPEGVLAAIDAVRERGAEGVVLSEPIDCGQMLIELDVPVLIFGHFPGLRAPHVISTMNAGDQNAERATQHLLDSGHATVHHIAGPDSWFAARERRSGWSRALRAAGLEPPAVVEGDWSAASGCDAAARLAQDPLVTAVFCANDDMALGALRGFRDAGRAVPTDVSVIGFDDVPLAEFSTPSLSTIRNPFESGAASGIEALVRTIEHPDDPTPHLVEPPGELVLRESTRDIDDPRPSTTGVVDASPSRRRPHGR